MKKPRSETTGAIFRYRSEPYFTAVLAMPTLGRPVRRQFQAHQLQGAAVALRFA